MAAKAKPSAKPTEHFTSQEYYGALQSLEAASMEQGKMSLNPAGEAFRLAEDLGADLRAAAEFVEQVRVTAQGADGTVTASSAVITPALLEGVLHAEALKPQSVDLGEMRAPALLGDYHAWKMQSAYPIPGSMLVDDVRRRFLSMYAVEAERALGAQRSAREDAVEVRLAVLDGKEEHRLPTAVEALLAQLQEVVRDKDEAVAANAQTALRTPAGEDDALIFEWMEETSGAPPRARPAPRLLAIEERFAKGMVSVGAVHPVHGVTGLMRACKLGILTVARLYLKAGADASFATERGVSCLHVCWTQYMALGKYAPELTRKIVFQATFDLISDLLEYGANPNTAGANGVTPLHMAASYGHDRICALLLRHGADRAWRDARGATPQAAAERQGHRAAAALLANWAHIEKSYKNEEWRSEWGAVLRDNAAAARASVEGERGSNGSSSGSGGGGGASPATLKRAKEALWGRAEDAASPRRAAALSDTAEVLRAQATQAALAAHRALARGSSDSALALGGGGSSAAAAALMADPRTRALAVIPMAEYDMERDALRAVCVGDDSEGAGESGARVALLRAHAAGDAGGGGGGGGEGAGGVLPWGRRPPPAVSAAAAERATALEEEEAGIEGARARGEAAREAMRANAGLGEGEKLVARQERDAGRGRGRARRGSSSDGAPRASHDKAHFAPQALTVPPGRAVNLVAVDEVAAQLAGVYGLSGAGGFAPEGLRAEMRVLEDAKASADAAMAERLAAIEEERVVQAEARAALLGSKPKGSGQWVVNRFGRSNFIRDEPTPEAAAALARRAAGEVRRGLRTDFEAATRRAREAGLGEKRRHAVGQAAARAAEVRAEEAAMNEDDLDELQRQRQHDYMMKWYVGENRAPPSDGSTVAARRAAAAVALRADAPSLLPGFTALLPVPGGAPGEVAVLTRKPASRSALLRPSRFRADTRPTIDAERIMSQGTAFESLVSGESVLALALPPSGAPLLAPPGDRASDAGEGSLTGAHFAVVQRAGLREGAGDRAATEDVRGRTLRSLAGRGLTVPLRQGYGELAANDAALLPYASFKRIASESAAINPVGTTKAAIAAAAQARYADIVAASGLAGAEASGGGGGGAGQALARALERANVQRVRRTLHEGVNALSEDMEAAAGALAAHNADVLEEVDYSARIPEGEQVTDVGAGAAPRKGGRVLQGAEKSEAEAVAAERKRLAEEARAALAARTRDRMLGLNKAPIPRTGVGALQTWPLHAPGPLPGDTAGVGGGMPGSGAAAQGTAGMVYRHYSVLDAVEASKRLAAEERVAAADALGKAKGLSTEAAEALRARAAGGAKANAAVQAASRSRAAAIAAQERAREVMSSQAHLVWAAGSSRAPAPKDRALPLLSGGALETEDYLARVRAEREYESEASKKYFAEEADTRGSRDRVLDVHQGARDPWEGAPRQINWARIEGKGQLL